MRIAMLLLTTFLCVSQARAERVTLPLDVGVGPAVHLITGKVFEDQPLHYGLKISLEAILDKRFIQRHSRKLPANYRQMARSMDEARITPSIFIPDTLFISPKIKDTGLYGVTWEPLAMNIPLVGDPKSAFRLRLNATLLATLAYLHSDTLPDTFFARPGVGLGASAEFKITKSFLISLGWTSGLYIPQQLGSFAMGSLEELDGAMWHFGQGWLKFHVRFPYTTNI